MLAGLDSLKFSFNFSSPRQFHAVTHLHKALPCWSLFTEGHITCDGHLSACCFDHSGRFQMGDLNRMSFMEAWNSQPFVKLRAAHLKKDLRGTVCENCIAY